jgi:hypothetical protein
MPRPSRAGAACRSCDDRRPWADAATKFIPVRVRWFDDKVQAAVAGGCAQVVVLGPAWTPVPGGWTCRRVGPFDIDHTPFADSRTRPHSCLNAHRRRPSPNIGLGDLGSGSPDALLHRGPLRTVHATRRGTRLKQALTLPCRSRRTPSRYCWTASSVLFTSRASNVSLGSGKDQHSSSRLTRLTSARFRGRAPGPVSGRLYGQHPVWRTGTNAPAFPLPFGHRHWLLGRPVPATESSSPHGRPAGPHPDGAAGP